MGMAGCLGAELESPQLSDWEIFSSEGRVRSMSLGVTMSFYRDGNSVVKSNKYKALGAPRGKSCATKIMS